MKRNIGRAISQGGVARLLKGALLHQSASCPGHLGMDMEQIKQAETDNAFCLNSGQPMYVAIGVIAALLVGTIAQ